MIDPNPKGLLTPAAVRMLRFQVGTPLRHATISRLTHSYRGQ